MHAHTHTRTHIHTHAHTHRHSLSLSSTDVTYHNNCQTVILHSKGDYVCYDIGQETGLMAQEAATDTFPNIGPTQNHTAAHLCQSTADHLSYWIAKLP